MEESQTKHKNPVLNFNLQDENGLNDFHKSENDVVVSIDKVGINHFRLPILYRYKNGAIRNHDAVASMYINCPEGKNGINMSRLCEILTVEAAEIPMSVDLFRKVLNRFRVDMRDHDNDPYFSDAYLKLKFKIVLKQQSLKSDNWGWQYYDVELEGRENKKGELKMYLTLFYEYSSTCPCSLSMAKQYEEEFQAGKTSEGSGIASAHSQRSGAKCTVEFDADSEFYIEDLVDVLRKAIPTETQSLVKRVDEQAFAILNGANPIFVEHASRNLSVELNAEKRIKDWVVSVEHWESLHSHNATAVIRKGIEGGLV